MRIEFIFIISSFVLFAEVYEASADPRKQHPCMRNMPASESCVKEASSECQASGGKWVGSASGRGRIIGCVWRTGDGGKSCVSSEECESVCVEHESGGRCYEESMYLGCRILEKQADGTVKKICRD